MITVKFKQLHPNAKLPVRAHATDAGFDLIAVSVESMDTGILVHTGLSMELPFGYEAQIRSRSGLASRGIFVTNSPGTIDSGYRGEIKVMLSSIRSMNMSSISTIVQAGHKVAQLVVSPVLDVETVFVHELEDSDRGERGFGSTGA